MEQCVAEEAREAAGAARAGRLHGNFRGVSVERRVPCFITCMNCSVDF